MIKKSVLFLTALNLFWLCGCMITTSDPAADRAFEVYQELHVRLPSAPVPLSAALGMAPAENHTAIMIAFAKIHILAAVKTPQAVLEREKARIELNTLLGFLPSDTVIYEAGNSFDFPAEIPHASAVEKAALIVDDGETPPLELLRKVRLAHADAAAAMNEAAINDSPEKRLAYVTSYIRLADAVGVHPAQLSTIEEFEIRFNSADIRWKKSH